ncbi:alpha/beta fold hydrolase [Streptomyces sp. NRRL WC-3725]|uniref:alpha/beta fold hydrolase n=1 Tax=Streptomyces sp. NRRL WC-3725 TaxID=1463933 RepID=UPI0004C625E0|nr:alpha/beta hydrolase [Streptomyces sp. NRRL WC-3725]KMS84813.1 alpha/beta hydrolase [Streptomyces regensis]
MYVDAPNKTVEAANGVTYAYRRCGPHHSPLLLLLQHFRGTLDSWDPALVDALATERDVITFDNAGVALSTGQVCHSVRDLARDTLAFMTALGLHQVDVLGHSMGGFTAQEMALLRPRAVRRLVLAATAPRGAPGVHGYTENVLAHAVHDPPGAENYLYTFFSHTETSQRSGLEFLGRYIEREDERDVPVTAAARDAQYDAVVEWGVPDHGALQRLEGVRQPVFVTGGDHDSVIPPRVFHLLGGLLPDARVKIYPDSGHGFLFQHHQEFARDVLDFLS